ncbi:MAG: hypothetical protein AAB325_07775, partial [Pseudomonadota bacterium]
MTDIPHEPTAFDLIAASTGRAHARQRRERLRNIGIGIAGLIALMVLWKLIVIVLKVPPYILPAPERVFTALWSGVAVAPASPLGFYLPLWSTLSNALLGFLIGASLGLVFGSLMAEFRP